MIKGFIVSIVGFVYALQIISIQNVNVEEAQNLIAQKKALQVIDVRTSRETEKGIINGAQIINWYDKGFFSHSVQKLDKNKPVLVYCKAGVRSARACSALIKEGFKEVYNLSDGYDEWKKQVNE